jgi:hypothetical protein
MVAPRSKAERLRDASFAEGGTARMAKPQAAGPARSGTTGKIQSSAPGAKRAVGGPKTSGHSLSTPAKHGHTAPVREKGR